MKSLTDKTRRWLLALFVVSFVSAFLSLSVRADEKRELTDRAYQAYVMGDFKQALDLYQQAGAENAFHAPVEVRLDVTMAELSAREPDVVLSAPAFSVALPGAKSVSVDPALAMLPVLDVPTRVRALYAALYPGQNAL